MNILTLILDNDAGSRTAARMTFAAYPELEVVGVFEKSEDLFHYLEENTAHLLFLDIELDGESGFDTARKLREHYPELMVVFLTGHSSYAIDGYDFHPVNFLTKPINLEKLSETIEEVKLRLKSVNRQSSSKLMFHLNQGGYRIFDVRDICYIERDNRKNYLCTEKESLRIMNYTMRDLDAMLSRHGFFLSHRSYILSLYRIISVRDIGRQLYEAVLRGCEKPIPISRDRYEELLRQLESINIQAVTFAKQTDFDAQ